MDRFKVPVYVGVWLMRDNQVFLLSRMRDNQETWGPITGKLEENESIPDAAKREVFEETGVEIDAQDLIFKHIVVHEQDGSAKHIGFHFVTTQWHGEPYNKEPNEHLRAEWFLVDALPDALWDVHRQALEKITKNNPFSIFSAASD